MHFRSPVTLILIIAAIASGFLGDPRDAAIILIIVLRQCHPGLYPGVPGGESSRGPGKKSCHYGHGLQRRNQTGYPDFGAGPRRRIQLTAGDIAPADARVIAAKDFFIDQSP